MAQQSTSEYFRYRIRRDARGVMAWFASNWREKKLFRWASVAVGGMLALFIIAWVLLARGLPDANSLLDYEPPLPTVVRGVDGEIVHSYARERRVQLQYSDFPRELVNAYLAAEDKTFFSHGGIDAGGLAGAVIDYVTKMGSDERAVGGSTITQQVAKNILLTNEYSVTRKLKEMMLARRIEGVLTKQQILELYLNEIPLGRPQLRRAGSSARLFRQGCRRPRTAGSRVSGDPAQGARNLRPRKECRTGDRHGAISCSTRWSSNDFITPAQAAAAKAKPLGLVKQQRRQAVRRCGLFPGGSSPPTDRRVWRDSRQRRRTASTRRTVGAHFA